jgi:murein DD-endopeptidase MepM/ murein hydrolase activator NlpD
LFYNILTQYQNEEDVKRNSDGTVTFVQESATLAKAAQLAGWDNWRDTLKGNNQGAVFYRGYDEVDVGTWFDERGNWIGGGNTLIGITMSNSEPTFTRPTTGTVSSPYGWRNDPETGKRKFHGGVDIANDIGTTVNSAAFGVVDYIGRNDQTWGNYVRVRHGSGYTTLYAHLSKITNWTKGVGTVLRLNPKVGEIGSTGYSTGPHLHYGKYRNNTSVNPFEAVG